MAYLFAPTEAQMDRFWRLYESTEQITGRNDALLDIICEQAQPYFAGDKTLEETAKLIQNRTAIFTVCRMAVFFPSAPETMAP